MKDFSYITSSSPAFIENLYLDYLKDPGSVDPEMKKFFEGFDFAMAQGGRNGNGKTIAPPVPEVSTAAEQNKAFVPTDTSLQPDKWMDELRVYRLILGYRNKGHLIADTNPI